MTTNKPEVVGYLIHASGEKILVNNITNPEGHDSLVRLSDYEAVQAECEKLRKLATECADYLDTNDMTSIAHGSVLHRRLIDAAHRNQGGGV